MEVGVFKESNFTDGIYTHGSSGYRVVATSAPSRHRGGITLFYQDLPNFVVKAMRQFRANFIACKLATGKTRWSIVGCYLVLGDGATIQDMETEVKECPRGIQLIVTGYLNADLERIGGRGQDEEIAAVVATAGLEDLLGHLLPRRCTWCKDRWTWKMVCQGRYVRSQMDYILVSDHHIFRNVEVQDPR